MLLLVFTYIDINKNYKVVMIDWRRAEGGGGGGGVSLLCLGLIFCITEVY